MLTVNQLGRFAVLTIVPDNTYPDSVLSGYVRFYPLCPWFAFAFGVSYVGFECLAVVSSVGVHVGIQFNVAQANDNMTLLPIQRSGMFLDETDRLSALCKLIQLECSEEDFTLVLA